MAWMFSLSLNFCSMQAVYICLRDAWCLLLEYGKRQPKICENFLVGVQFYLYFSDFCTLIPKNLI